MHKLIALTILLIGFNVYSPVHAGGFGDAIKGLTKTVAADAIGQVKGDLSGMLQDKIEETGNEFKDSLNSDCEGEDCSATEEAKSKKIFRKYPKPGKVTSKDIPKVFNGKYRTSAKKTAFGSYAAKTNNKYAFKKSDLPTKVWK